MTSIDFYPKKAWRSDNEALLVTASASPSEALYPNSALGASLHQAAEELSIDTYPNNPGVVFEGTTAKIEARREQLVRCAPEIAKYATDTFGYDGSPDSLQAMIRRFGAPHANHPEDSFSRRIIQGVSDFADDTSWDGCSVNVHNQEYQEPLDYRLIQMLQDERFTNPELSETNHGGIAGLSELESQQLIEFATLNYLQPEQLRTAGLRYVIQLLQDDPALRRKIIAKRSVPAGILPMRPAPPVSDEDRIAAENSRERILRHTASEADPS